jgi:hypothetical protein
VIFCKAIFILSWPPKPVQKKYIKVLGLIQGGSDISGTLSKLHRRFKKQLFYSLFRAKLSQLFVEMETKTNRHVPAKINLQKAVRAIIVSRLRAAGLQWERFYRPARRSSSPGTTAGPWGPLVQETNISITNAGRFLGSEDLRYKPYAMRRGQSYQGK